MPNAFVTLPVPSVDGVGAWVDTSGMAPGKTLTVDGGVFSGQLYIESSNDGQASAVPVNVAPFVGGAGSPVDVEATLQFMRVRRIGSNTGPVGAPTVAVSAEVATSNVFGSMNVTPGDGTGTAIDLSSGGAVNTFNIAGPFSGQVTIQVSGDGVNFSPVFTVGLVNQTSPSPAGINVIGVVSSARVVRNGSLPGQPAPLISAGSGGESGGGGSFPGFGGAPPAVAATSSAGGAGTASRSDHTHAGVASVGAGTGITVTGTASAPIINVTAPAPAFATAGAPGPTALGTAGSASTVGHSDQTAAAYRSDLPLASAYWIDPVNGSDAASNPGTSSATALKTLQELKRRWWGAEISVSTTINLLGNTPSTDVGAWFFTILPTARVTLLGSLGPTTGFGGAAIDNTLYSGTVTGYAACSNAPSATDNELTDSAIPVSYTASGLLAKGVGFKRTSSTDLRWWAMSDLGSKTLRVSTPQLSSTVQLNNALTVGDAYSAYSLWTVFNQDWGVNYTRVRYDTVNNQGTTTEAPGTSNEQFHGWVNCSLKTVALQFVNCCMDCTAGGFLSGSAEPQGFASISGLFLGTGASGCVLQGFFEMGPLWTQGCQLNFDDGRVSFPGSSIGVCDCTIPNFSFAGTAQMAFIQNTIGNGLVGKGNTSKLLSLSVGPSTCYYGNSSAFPPFFAGSTSDPNPITLGQTSYPVSALPAQPEVLLTPYQASFPASSPVQNPYPVVALESPVIDLTTVAAGFVMAPAIANRRFIPFRFEVLQVVAAGTLSTAATVQMKYGANTLLAATNGLTNGTAFAFGVGGLLASVGTEVTSAQNTACTIDVTVAATGTGGFAYGIKILYFGYYSAS